MDEDPDWEPPEPIVVDRDTFEQIKEEAPDLSNFTKKYNEALREGFTYKPDT